MKTDASKTFLVQLFKNRKHALLMRHPQRAAQVSPKRATPSVSNDGETVKTMVAGAEYFKNGTSGL